MPAPDLPSGPIDFAGRPAEIITGAIRGSGLVSAGDKGVVLVSGGADSTALLLGLREFLGAGSLTAIHVNYGLRDSADEDEQLVSRLCERTGIGLRTHRAGAPEGNVQAWAREIRLGFAEEVRSREGLDWIAVGHNLDDQVETFLYRLASAPGVRSLLAMPPRSGKVIRPLLSLDGETIRELMGGIVEYAEDPTNRDPSFARNRVRLRVIPELEEINRAAGENISRTRAELVEDEGAITEAAIVALRSGDSNLELGFHGSVIASQPPAVRRRMIRILAEETLDRPVAVNRDLAADVVRLTGSREGGILELGGGDHLVIEAGRVRVVSGGGTGDGEVPEPVAVREARDRSSSAPGR